MRILDADSMRQVDRTAIEDFGIPSLVLMENAAIGLADALADNFPAATTAAIFCGPGNNGGDGLALARHLSVRGYHVEILLFGAGKPLSTDSQAQFNICQSQGLSIREVGPDDEIHNAISAASRLDLVVDALFGIGLSRPLEGQFADLVDAINGLAIPILAVDLPSGLNGSSFEIQGPHVQAALTVTFAAPKIAHVFFPAAEVVGDVVVADLGIPPELVERATGDLHLLVGSELRDLIVPRPLATHKGDFGHVVLVAGSVGKAGAAILAARGAVRTGAGLVTVAVPDPIVQTVDGGSLESMTLSLPWSDDGGLLPPAAARILESSADKDVMAIGPGLGLDKSTIETVHRLISDSSLPLVLDADGLNAVGTQLELLRSRSADTVLTPHPGELGRLLGKTPSEVQGDRLGIARQAADETQSIVVLKGHRTLIADPVGGLFVNPTGNPSMASGGSGDVLTGIIAALIGQGWSALDAAKLGTYLHGLAGDLISQSELSIGFSASDLVAAIPQAIERLGQ
jgi:NAD(P)H-hydrate epimerase